jgi:hypothetical protein
MLVLDGPRVVVRDAILLFIVPAMLLGRLARRYLVAFCLMLVCLFANPIAGPRMMTILTPGAYWRLCYLLPLPLCFGLTVSGFTTRRLSPLSLLRMIVSIVAVLSVFWSLSATVFHQAYTKSPSELKFLPREYEFVRAAMPEIRQGSVVLAPEEIVCVLALVRPDLRFEAARPLEATRVFRSAGKAVDGKTRTMAQSLLFEREPPPQSEAAFLKVLDNRIDYLFARSPSFPAARRLLDERGVTFSVKTADQWYTFASLGPYSSAPPGPR